MSSISWWSSYLKMKIWSGQNRANLHLCMTEKILSRMTIPALIIHHVVLAASLSKKKNKIDYQCWTHERICHFCFVGFFLMIIPALIVHHIVWLQLMIWTWKNRANFHLCITENILSRMTIPALIIHHVVLAASLSKKKNKIDYQCWTHERICHFCFVGFFFLCTGIDVWEAKDWKHCFPNI